MDAYEPPRTAPDMTQGADQNKYRATAQTLLQQYRQNSQHHASAHAPALKSVEFPCDQASFFKKGIETPESVRTRVRRAINEIETTCQRSAGMGAAAAANTAAATTTPPATLPTVPFVVAHGGVIREFARQWGIFNTKVPNLGLLGIFIEARNGSSLQIQAFHLTAGPLDDANVDLKRDPMDVNQFVAKKPIRAIRLGDSSRFDMEVMPLKDFIIQKCSRRKGTYAYILMRHALSVNNALTTYRMPLVAAKALLHPQDSYIYEIKKTRELGQRIRGVLLQVHSSHKIQFFVSPMSRTMQTLQYIACSSGAINPSDSSPFPAPIVLDGLQEVRKSVSDDLPKKKQRSERDLKTPDEFVATCRALEPLKTYLNDERIPKPDLRICAPPNAIQRIVYPSLSVHKLEDPKLFAFLESVLDENQRIQNDPNKRIQNHPNAFVQIDETELRNATFEFASNSWYERALSDVVTMQKDASRSYIQDLPENVNRITLLFDKMIRIAGPYYVSFALPIENLVMHLGYYQGFNLALCNEEMNEELYMNHLRIFAQYFTYDSCHKDTFLVFSVSLLSKAFYYPSTPKLWNEYKKILQMNWEETPDTSAHWSRVCELLGDVHRLATILTPPTPELDQEPDTMLKQILDENKLLQTEIDGFYPPKYWVLKSLSNPLLGGTKRVRVNRASQLILYPPGKISEFVALRSEVPPIGTLVVAITIDSNAGKDNSNLDQMAAKRVKKEYFTVDDDEFVPVATVTPQP